MKLPYIQKAIPVYIPTGIFGESALKSSNNWIESIANSWRADGRGKRILCYIRSHPLEGNGFLVSGNDHSYAKKRQRDEWCLSDATVEQFLPDNALNESTPPITHSDFQKCGHW